MQVLKLGGLGCFAIYMSGNVYDVLPPASTESGKKVIADWNYSTGGYHAMTFVGYNDNIKYDINGDGLFTNHLDTNGDGIVDMRDWEIGALKIANSWGENWGNGNYGFVYFPYRLLAKKAYNPNNPNQYKYAITDKRVYVLIAKEEYTPELTVKTSVEYPCRKKLKFNVGYANNANQTTPVENTNYSSFRNQGGSHPMQGINYDPIEVGLDFGHWYSNKDVGKIYLIINEQESGVPTSGLIEYFSIVDYRWGEVFELYCDETNVAIVNNGATRLSIDYDLIPHESDIVSNLSLFSNMVSRFTPTVDRSATLTVEDGVRIDMYESEIHINAGCSLILEDNVTFLAKTGNCKLIIDGNISIGSNVSFISEDGAQLDVFVNNPNIQVSFNHSLFEKTKLHSYAQDLTITQSTFNNCYGTYSYRGNVTIESCYFTETCLYLENQTSDVGLSASIIDCNVSNTNTEVGIDIQNYSNFFIENNNIKAWLNGLQIHNSGGGTSGNQIALGNNIHDCSRAGMVAYNTTASIKNNYIHNNHVGVKLLSNSNIALYGNPAAQSNAQTQQIRDNASLEIYVSKHSFPWYFHYNVIIDEDNIGNPIDPLLYFAYPGGAKINTKDIRYNCWGNNFNASVDLFPASYFVYNPVWCPGSISIASDVAEQLYIDGRTQFEAGQYNEAKAIFLLLIEQFPKTVYAEAAMKELVALEKFASDDYTTLKTYFQTNDSIQSDSTLRVLASALANKCDVKLENWAQAISWYENQIINPASLEDSVFAIIDLGYVYFLMENQGLRSAYTGKLLEFKPESKEQYFEHRDYLLSLLPGKTGNKDSQQSLTQLTHGKLLQNVPNPFSGHTQIWYTTDIPARITISITDITGKEVGQINQDQKAEGTHQADFNNAKLSPGIYFYSLVMDGVVSDTRKMSIIR